jgi:hypothetical protein
LQESPIAGNELRAAVSRRLIDIPIGDRQVNGQVKLLCIKYMNRNKLNHPRLHLDWLYAKLLAFNEADSLT